MMKTLLMLGKKFNKRKVEFCLCVLSEDCGWDEQPQRRRLEEKRLSAECVIQAEQSNFRQVVELHKVSVFSAVK